MHIYIQISFNIISIYIAFPPPLVPLLLLSLPQGQSHSHTSSFSSTRTISLSLSPILSSNCLQEASRTPPRTIFLSLDRVPGLECPSEVSFSSTRTIPLPYQLFSFHYCPSFTFSRSPRDNPTLTLLLSLLRLSLTSLFSSPHGQFSLIPPLSNFSPSHPAKTLPLLTPQKHFDFACPSRYNSTRK